MKSEKPTGSKPLLPTRPSRFLGLERNGTDADFSAIMVNPRPDPREVRAKPIAADSKDSTHARRNMVSAAGGGGVGRSHRLETKRNNTVPRQ
jgi:hypothetical protein